MKSSFELSDIVTKTLKSKLQAYHGLFRHNKCEAKEIEELIATALDIDPEYAGAVEWKPGSHEPGSDIIIRKKTFSIKSGVIKKGVLVVSGNRLTRAKGDFNTINSLLKSYVSDYTICFVHDEETGTYQIIYIDASVFSYPNSAQSWVAKMGKKEISAYRWTPPSGLEVEIRPSMSWQVWWSIPTDLCRMGPLLTTK